MPLEDQLWAQLEAAAERQGRRGPLVRAGAAAGEALALRRVVPAAVALLVVVGALAMVMALRPQATQSGWHVEQFTRVSGDLSAGAAGFGSLWTYDLRSGEILRVDFGTHRVVARIPLATDLPDVAIATSGDAVWAVPVQPSTHTPVPPPAAAAVLTRIDPARNRITDRIPLRAPDGSTILPVGIVARRSAMWVWGEAGAQRIDPGRSRVSAAVKVPGDVVRGFAATDARVSVATEFGRLVTFDARTASRLATVPVPAPIFDEALVAVGDAIVIDRLDGSIASIDPISGRTHWSARVGRQPTDIAIAGDTLWVVLGGSDAQHDVILGLDPHTGHTITRLALNANDARALAATRRLPLVMTATGKIFIATRPDSGHDGATGGLASP